MIFLYITFFHVYPRAEIVRWVAESKWPFKIVKDCGFEGPITLSNPTDNLGSRIDMKEGYIEKNHIVCTSPHLLCAEYVDRLPYPSKFIEIQPGSTHPEVLSLRAHLVQHQDSVLQ